jgi:hypothetical protein
LRRSSQSVGGRNAIVSRARLLLNVNDGWLDGVAGLEQRVDVTQQRVDVLQQDLDAAGTSANCRLDKIEAVVADLVRGQTDRRAELIAQIEPVTTWVRRAPAGSTRISVVLATYNRAALVHRAVESVIAQEYPHWELVIVDDGSTDDTAGELDKLAARDDRIRVVASAHCGASTARNVGLSAVSGEIICYVDDDNTMEPLWLKAVAWAFDRHPDLRVLYGARVAEAEILEDERGPVLPAIQFEPFDRDRLERGNYIDLGVLAHRRSLPEAQFDQSLAGVEDWDLVLRLTRDGPAFALPVVASMYWTSAPDRLTRSEATVTAISHVSEGLRADRGDG